MLHLPIPAVQAVLAALTVLACLVDLSGRCD
jgi:hypothetical protein